MALRPLSHRHHRLHADGAMTDRLPAIPMIQKDGSSLLGHIATIGFMLAGR
jgi:hypothetical protein